MAYLDNIAVFVRVVELGNLSAAGRDMRISPAVASNRIKELEKHLGGRDQIFLDMIEAATMHLPFLAEGAGRQARPLAQAEVERDEIEGRADPGDAGDDVQPSRRETQPIPEDREIVHAGPSLPVRDFTACDPNGKGAGAR